MRFLTALILLCSSGYAVADTAITASHQQLILVITPDWNSIQGHLRNFERHNGQWLPAGTDTAVTLGKNGSAWGKGLHPEQQGQQKQEGDGKAPAGIFTLGTAFGYQAESFKLPYQPMSASHYCVDVNGSPLYNQIVDTQHTGEDAVKGSTEPMRRDIHENGDLLYKLGLVVEHNPQNISAAGSCIFMHLWRSDTSPTAGCTAMPESELRQLLSWLDPAKTPVMVLLPQTEYDRLKQQWDLPAL